MKGGAHLGLRLYPMNLIRTVPAEGLDFKIWCTLFHLDLLFKSL